MSMAAPGRSAYATPTPWGAVSDVRHCTWEVTPRSAFWPLSTKQGQLFETTFEATSHCRSPQIMSSSPACFTVQQVQKSFEPQNNFGRFVFRGEQPFTAFRHLSSFFCGAKPANQKRRGQKGCFVVVGKWKHTKYVRNIYPFAKRDNHKS